MKRTKDLPLRGGAACLLAIGLVVSACSSDDGFTTASADGDRTTATVFPLTLSVQPASLLLAPGKTASVSVSLATEDRVSDTFTIVASRLPAGITMEPVEVTRLDAPSSLAFVASSSAAPGVTTTVILEASGRTSHGSVELELTTTAPAPVLDPTFGDGGKARVGAGIAREELGAVALQADGKIVVAGSYRTGYATLPAIARYLAAGTLDASFGQAGVVLLDKHEGSPAVAIAVQPDGKIVVLEPSDFTLTRLEASGAIDTTFNGTGSSSALFPDEARGAAVVLQPDGKILVAGGAADATGAPDFALARFLADGTLDASFGAAGRVVTAVGAGEDAATALAIETSGGNTVKIVAVGSVVIGAGRAAVVARYLGASGALDTTFATGGVATFSSGAAAEDFVSGVVVTPNGGVVASGHRHVGAETDRLQILRFTSAGALDATFDGDGVAAVTFPVNARSRGLFARTDGAIVVAAEIGVPSQAALVRLDAAGALDATFGTGGKVTPSIQDESSARAVAQAADGAIVIVGSAAKGTNADALVARFTSAGVIDTTFAGDGDVTTSFGPGDEELRAVAVQSDGKIIAAGTAFNGRDFDVLVARRLATGGPDTTFGGGRGYVLYDRGSVGPSSELGYDLRLQADGKIVVGGQGGEGALVVRLLPDGALDGTFGVAGAAVVAGGVCYGVGLQPDGKIIVGGPGADGDFFVARLTTAGLLDAGGAPAGFGAAGALTTTFGLPARAIALTVDASGTIVMAGHVEYGKPPNFFDLAVSRYEPNGALDVTFAGDGTMTFDTASVELLYGLAVQADGKILLGGRMQRPGRATSFGVFRVAASGGIDKTFGDDGRARVDLGDGSQVSALAVEPGRMILAAGRSSDDKFLLSRLSPSGSPIWPSSGAVTTAFGSRAEAFALARQLDGRVVLAGVGRGTLEDQAVLVRYAP